MSGAYVAGNNDGRCSNGAAQDGITVDRHLSPAEGERTSAEGWAFDPFVAAAVLRKLAELTSERLFLEFVPPSAPIFVCAVGVLHDAKRWLEQRRSPVDDFAGDAFLMASIDPLLTIRADAFANALLCAALELVTVARLADLRCFIEEDRSRSFKGRRVRR